MRWISGDVARHLNKFLGIKLITGTAYHPQVPGAVESMRKTLILYVRGIVQGEAEKWEEALMFAQMILRSSPMACIGRRSPHEVVTALKPRMSQTLWTGVPVEMGTLDDHVRDLAEHLKEVHSAVQRTTLETIERDANTLAGRINLERNVADPVLVRREGTVERSGPTRFQERVLDGIFVIKRKIGPKTFVVEDLVDKSRPINLVQPLLAERLVKLDMPELELRADQPRSSR